MQDPPPVVTTVEYILDTEGLDTIENALACAMATKNLKKGERTRAFRELLYAHRPQMLMWLQQNGCTVPPDLFNTSLQPKPGHQPSVDADATQGELGFGSAEDPAGSSGNSSPGNGGKG